MKAEIKRLHSPDVINLERYVPEDPECFSFLLQIMAGLPGQEGEESFDVQVCTPSWLIKTYKQSDMVIGRHLLIIFEYNYGRLIDAINEYVDICEGESWDEIAAQLGRFGRWEFEDYEP